MPNNAAQFSLGDRRPRDILLYSSPLQPYNGGLLRQPASRLPQFVRLKKLHWGGPDSSPGERQSKHFPARLAHDRDFRNFGTVRHHEVVVGMAFAIESSVSP